MFNNALLHYCWNWRFLCQNSSLNFKNNTQYALRQTFEAWRCGRYCAKDLWDLAVAVPCCLSSSSTASKNLLNYLILKHNTSKTTSFCTEEEKLNTTSVHCSYNLKTGSVVKCLFGGKSQSCSASILPLNQWPGPREIWKSQSIPQHHIMIQTTCALN